MHHRYIRYRRNFAGYTKGPSAGLREKEEEWKRGRPHEKPPKRVRVRCRGSEREWGATGVTGLQQTKRGWCRKLELSAASFYILFYLKLTKWISNDIGSAANEEPVNCLAASGGALSICASNFALERANIPRFYLALSRSFFFFPRLLLAFLSRISEIGESGLVFFRSLAIFRESRDFVFNGVVRK